MSPITYTTSKFIVLHGHANGHVHLLAYEPPAKISTGQPNIEAFDTAQEAIDRAIELGVAPLLTSELWPRDAVLNLATGKLVALPNPIPAFDPDATYDPGSVVRYTITEETDGEQVSTELTWLKISDAHPSVPDMTFNLEAGTGDWILWEPKPAPVPPPEPTPEERRIAALEARLAALEAA